MKGLIQSFIPWIFYFVLAGDSQFQLDMAIIVAAVTSLYFDRKDLKKGFILSWGTVLFFLFMLISVVCMKNKWIAHHAWIFSNGTLALIAFGSLAIRIPFTIQYARDQVSPDKWQHPVFIRINFILTGVWGLSFLAAIGLHVVKPYLVFLTDWMFEILTYIPSIFAVWFTLWFPGWYRLRMVGRG